jgi:hypothetical protein
LLYDLCERIWLSIDDSERLMPQVGYNDGLDTMTGWQVIVDVTETVTIIVTVAVIMVVTVGLHLYFRVEGRGKERGLYPPSG